MLVAVAVCPHPPMLVPEIAQGATGELDDLRTACDEAVRGLAGARPEQIIVVAGGDGDARLPGDAVPDLTAYGLTYRQWTGDPGPPQRRPRLGLGASVGAWLLDRGGVRVPRAFVQTTGEPIALGDARTALLVMADGTAKRTADAPGHLDDRAEGYDADIAKALATADAEALGRLDPALGARLWAQGIPALHALGATVAVLGAPRARLLYDAAPYGVGYFVALWSFQHRLPGCGEPQPY